MNIFKIVLVLLTGLGFGFGVEKLADTEIKQIDNQNSNEEYNNYMYFEQCHGVDDWLYHMLDDLTEEDRVVVEAKIDELLIEYDTTIEGIFDNHDVHYAFMSDLMGIFEEHDIDYYRHNHHDSDDVMHHGMRR